MNKNAEPLISVIVPVYNGEQWIEGCIKSICASEYQNLEILVIDDGSTDGSGKICRMLGKKDSRIRIYTQTNQGVSQARNMGLLLAEGEYISFVDCDDTVEASMYNKLMEAVNPNTVMVQFGFQRVTEAGKVLSMYHPHNSGKGQNLLNEYLYPRKPAGVWSKLYRSCYLKHSGGLTVSFPLEIHIWEDLLFQCRYLSNCPLNGEITIVEDTLYHYYMNQSGVSKQPFSEKNMEVLDVFDEIFQICGKDSDSRKQAELAYCEILIKTILRLYRSRTKEKKQWKKELFRELKKYEGAYLKNAQPEMKMKILLLLLKVSGA